MYAEKYANGENVPLSVSLRGINGGKKETLMQLEELVRNRF